MSDRGKEGEKDISRRDCASSGGGACPSRISFSTSSALRKHVSSPRPGNRPFSRPCTSHSTAWPGNRPFFRPCTSHSTAWPGNQHFFRPYPSQIGVCAGQVLVLRAVWPRRVRFRGMGDGYSSVGARWGGRAEYHKGRRFLALVTVKTYFCPSVYHLNYV